MIVRRSVFTFGVQILQLAAMLAVTVLVTRVTGAEGKGVYTLVPLVVTLATLATGLGVSWASIYHISKGTFPLRESAGTLVTASLGSAALATAALAVAFVLFRGSYFHDLSSAQIEIGLAATPFFQLTVGLGAILLGLNRVVQYTALNLVQAATALVLQLVLALAGQLSPTSALMAWAVGVATGLGVAVWLVGRHAPLWPRFSVRVFRACLGYGIKGYIANLMTLLNYRLDALIVNGMIGVASLGIYSISVAMGELLWYVPNSIGLVMFPHISGLAREEADRVTPVVTRNTLFITLVAAAGLFIVSRWVVLIVFGPTMLPAVQPLWLLLPGVVALSAGKVIASYLSGIGRPIYATYISAVTVVLTVFLDLTLIPRFGIQGAAVSSSTVYITATALSIVVFIRESGSGWWETLVIQPADFARYRELAISLRHGFRGVPMAPESGVNR